MAMTAAERDEAKRYTPDQLKKVRRCKESVFWTAWYLLEYRKLSVVLHWMMAKWLKMRISEGYQRILVMIPRDYYKTSLLGVAGVVHHLINHPDDVILYVMHKQEMAQEKMSEVRAAFEGQMMQDLFPELHVSKTHKAQTKWGDKSFTIPRENLRGTPSVTCNGIISGATGGHYDLIIWDDPIKGDDDDAMAQMESARRKLRKVTFLWKNKRASHGHAASMFWVFGTLWEGGFYEDLMARRKFAKLILGAYVDDRFMRVFKETGTVVPAPDSDYMKDRVLPENHEKAWQEGQPIFPEAETMESLEDTKEDAGPDFTTQMLNIPSGAMERKFQREDCVPYTMTFDSETGRPLAVVRDGVAFPMSSLFISVTVDPTGGMSKECDAAAVTVMGWARSHALGFMLDFWHGRDDPKVQIEKTLDLAQKWNARVISPESNSYQVTYQFWLRDLMVKRGLHIEIDPFKRGHKSKDVWIYSSLSPYIANRQIAFMFPRHEEAVRQLVELKTRDGKVLGESPALVDSMVMHTKFWSRRKPRKARLEDGIAREQIGPEYKKPAVKYGLRLSAWSGGMNA